MLAVHWTPVKNTKHILRNGITKSKNGLYCFPLTGHRSLDRWWLYFFNQCKIRHKKNYNGIVFRIKQEDLPAYFGDWLGASNKDIFNKKINTTKELTLEYRNNTIWRLGEILAQQKNIDYFVLNNEQCSTLFIGLVEDILKQSPKFLVDAMNNLNLMTDIFENFQIVLSHSIPPKRIIKILPQGDEFGKVRRMKKDNIAKVLQNHD